MTWEEGQAELVYKNSVYELFFKYEKKLSRTDDKRLVKLLLSDDIEFFRLAEIIIKEKYENNTFKNKLLKLKRDICVWFKHGWQSWRRSSLPSSSEWMG